ncbi:MAG: sulfotransferase family protein [Saprospiraceae bacterium]|nr:sulfotransferase family protein [Saprospiraceae bacterium]
MIVDFVGKYENLANDFEHIKKKIGINDSLNHLNKSRDNRDYLKYYNPETIDLVWEAYQEDITLFDYKKPII